MRRHGSGQRQVTNISVSHAGGAAAAYPAFTSVPDLNEIQSPLAGMKPLLDQTSNSPFSTSGTVFYANPPSYEPTIAGDPSYQDHLRDCFPSPSSNTNCYLDNSQLNILGDTSHQDLHIGVNTDPPTADPWSHLVATQGGNPPFPQSLSPTGVVVPPQQSIRKRPRDRSPGSGRGSFRDSAYSTLPQEARHEQEAMLGLSSNFNNINMDQDNMSLQSLQHGQHPLPEFHPPSQQGDFPTYPMQMNPQPYIDQSSTVSRQTSKPQRRGRGTSPTTSLLCEECNYTAKSRSDLNKHNARHDKKYKCETGDCARQDKAFPTLNDLDRHLKSVHGINIRRTKDYRCFAKDCTKPDKTWPRLDNFKQHLKSMHKSEDLGELLKKSEQWYDELIATTQSQYNDETSSNYQQSQVSVGDINEVDNNNLMHFQPTLSNQYPEQVDPNMQQMMSPQLDMMAPSPIDPRLQTPHARLQDTHHLNHRFNIPQSRFQGSHNRRASSPEPSSVRVQQRPVPFRINTTNMNSQITMMQRTVSQTSHPQTQSAFPAASAQNQFTDFPQLSDYPWDVRMGVLQTRGNQYLELPTREQKRPHTTPDPILEPNRIATDFSSPLEIQSALDQGTNNDELLGNMGWSADAGGLQATPQHPALVVHPPSDEPNSRRSTLHVVVEEEIHHFLQQYKDQESSLLQEDIRKLIRLSLRNSFDTITNADSSVRSMIGLANDNEQPPTPEGKKSPADKEESFPCPHAGCSSVSKRASGLKKHLQRHKKPYGCTFDGCNKVFGSKNDWKRHEQGQHEQKECWRCHKCEKAFFHGQNTFIDHLMQEHGVKHTGEAMKQAKLRSIPRNNQRQFWCGFCNRIVSHDLTGVEAFNSRADHIALHFKEGNSSGDWIELRGCGKTKAAMRDESRVQSPASAEDEEEEDNPGRQNAQMMPENHLVNSFAPGNSMPSGSPTGHQSLSQYSSSTTEMNLGNINTNMSLGPSGINTQWVQQLGTGHETMSTQMQPSRLSAPAQYIVCCHCNNSYTIALKQICIDCNHPAKGCSRCKPMLFDPNSDDMPMMMM
ncbi:hypothetical protein LTR84_004547 [Exophiala bonariae]|uniref:C2H2-type domain-containing protein n=1 Tax=Exophiala bonariae TaxID=1690606 RepID=A0AAV9NRB3_9EURO|nr:hypothetical protein LTR84_004547 [Exophiala bonariae]